MIKKLLFLTLLLFPSLAWADSQLLYQATDTRDGMNSHDFPSKILNTQVQDALNVFLNDKSGQVRRAGINIVNSTTPFKSKSMWDFFGTSNNEWLIRLDTAGYLRAGTNIGSAGSSFSVIIATLATNVTSDATPCLGEFWITNQSNGLLSWNESAVTKHTNAPNAARVECFKNRIILGDIVNRQSSVDASGNENGSDWNNDSRFSTSPFSVPIGGVNDGGKVYEIKVGIDELVIFKAFSTHALGIPSGQNDYFIRDINSKIGTIYPETVDQYNGATLFVSNRGLDSYYPPATFQLSPLSLPVQSLLDPLAEAGASGKNRIITSLDQWRQGVSSPTGNISTSLSSGSITPENHQFTETAGSDWGRGTISYPASLLSTNTTIGSLVFTSTPQALIQNRSFEDHFLTFSTASLLWNTVSSVSGSGTKMENVVSSSTLGINDADGAFVMFQANTHPSISTQIAISLLDATSLAVLDSQVSNLSATTPANGWIYILGYPIPQNLIGRACKIRLNAYQKSAAGDITSSTMTSVFNFYPSTGNINMYYQDYCLGSPTFVCGLSFGFLVLDTPRPDSDFRALYTSRVFDSVALAPNYDPLRATVLSGTVTFAIRTSSDQVCCFGPDIALTTGTVPTNTKNRFFVYVASFSVTPATTSATIQIDDVALGGYVTGYYQTETIDTGEDITSWGLFSANQSLDDGQITYQVNSSSWSQFSPTGWASQSLNAVIVAPVNRYIAARVNFQTQASTDNPIVTDLTFNWNEGEAGSVPIGRTFKENYHLFFSTALGMNSTNDKALILEKARGVSLHSGFNVSAAAGHSNKFYVGDANATGNTYDFNGSTDGTDNGTPIVSYVTYRRIDAGKEESDKVLDKCYFTISRADTSASQIFDVDYFVDGSTYTVASDFVEISTGVSVAVLKSMTSIAREVRGKFFDVRIKERGTSKGYSIQSFKAYGTIIEPD